MILSDRTIKKEIAEGRIIIEPFDRVDRSSRRRSTSRLDHRFIVFRNHTMGHIDVKANLEELTETVEVSDDDPFILHPGEFVLGLDGRTGRHPRPTWSAASRASRASAGSGC